MKIVFKIKHNFRLILNNILLPSWIISNMKKASIHPSNNFGNHLAVIYAMISLIYIPSCASWTLTASIASNTAS